MSNDFLSQSEKDILTGKKVEALDEQEFTERYLGERDLLNFKLRVTTLKASAAAALDKSADLCEADEMFEKGRYNAFELIELSIDDLLQKLI